MSFSLYNVSPLKRFSVNFLDPTSAVSTSCCPHSASERRSLNIASNLRSQFGSLQCLHFVRDPEQRPFGVASISNLGITVGGKSFYHPNAGYTSDSTSLSGYRCTRSLLGGAKPKKSDLRDGLRQRSADILKRVPSTTSRSAKASDNTRFTSYEREPWQTQKSALSKKFGSLGWAPRKRLSPDSLEGIRTLHAQYPDRYTTSVLAEQFKVSPEAIRRILKSKWRPNDEQEDDRRERWNKRGMSIWGQMNELGIKPPRKWREQGVGKFEREQPTSKGPHGPSSQARRKGSSETDRFLESRPAVPAVRPDVDQAPLADRIL